MENIVPKGENVMISFPQRTREHIIDEKACRIVEKKFVDEWIIRDLTGRDYGIDKVCERFEKESAAGDILFLQVKGTGRHIDPNNPRFSIKVETLQYSELFAVPFILVFCETTGAETCYYLWLQEYIRIVLDHKKPEWRKHKTVTVYFPKENVLGTTRANKHLKFISELVNHKNLYIDFINAIINIPCTIRPTVDENTTNLEMNDCIKETQNVLKRASVPFKLLTKNMGLDVDIEDTILLGNELLSDNRISRTKYYHYVCNCYFIYNQISSIGLKYDECHLRFLYDMEKLHNF